MGATEGNVGTAGSHLGSGHADKVHKDKRVLYIGRVHPSEQDLPCITSPEQSNPSGFVEENVHQDATCYVNIPLVPEANSFTIPNNASGNNNNVTPIMTEIIFGLSSKRAQMRLCSSSNKLPQTMEGTEDMEH